MVKDDQVRLPFTILVDNREQSRYHFHGIRGDSKQSYRPLIVETRLESLKTGDYTLEGAQQSITVERKSLDDLFQSLGRSRVRFEKELTRMQELVHPFIVVEAGLFDILKNPPKWTQLSPKVVYRTILSWQLKYPKTHWLLCDNRRLAEISTFRVLQRFWDREHAGS